MLYLIPKHHHLTNQHWMYKNLNLLLWFKWLDWFFKFILQKPLSDTNFLHDMDKSTQEIITVQRFFFIKIFKLLLHEIKTFKIIKHILNLQSNQLASNEVGVPGATEKVKLIRPVTLAELRKWRQQFLTYIKMHPPSNSTTLIPNMFVEYINCNI